MSVLDLFDVECADECDVALISENTLCLVHIRSGRAVSLYIWQIDRLIVDYNRESGYYTLTADNLYGGIYKAKAVRVLDKDELVVVLDRVVKELKG